MSSLYCLEDSSGRHRFRIYVCQVGPDTLYVGSTAKSVAERVSEHRGDGRAWRYRRDLSPPTVCATRERAESIERRTAERLRRRGWEVEQG